MKQESSKASGVRLDRASGQIALHAAALAAGASVSFVLTNGAIAATDTVLLNIASGASADSYRADVTAVADGSCRIQLWNFSRADLAEALVLNFTVIKGANA